MKVPYETDSNLELLIDQDDPGRASWVRAPLPPLEAGEIALRIEKFGLTANNITYATLGKSLRWFELFPAPDPERQAKLPVWGVATVVASEHAGVARGERVYGCFPLARFLKLRPSAVSPGQLDLHRPQLPPDYALYGQYQRAAADPLYTAEHEDAMVLLRPLWLTGFLLDDFLNENGYFDAEAVVISSASSKASFGLADLLTRGRGRRVIGLTSKGNAAFVRRLGTYTEVVTYDQIDGLRADGGAVLVDVAGSEEIVKALHGRLGDGLKARIVVGKSHAGAPAGAPDPSGGGVKTRPFFAPGWAKQRAEALGPAELGRRMAAGWSGMLRRVGGWIEVQRRNGPDAVLETYQQLLAGKATPEAGYILSLWEGPDEAA